MRGYMAMRSKQGTKLPPQGKLGTLRELLGQLQLAPRGGAAGSNMKCRACTWCRVIQHAFSVFVQVTRGTIQAVLKHTAFDEARRLGLQPDTEALLRKEFPKETGVLSVGEVVPKGPADGALEPGDVVVRMVRALACVLRTLSRYAPVICEEKKKRKLENQNELYGSRVVCVSYTHVGLVGRESEGT